MVKAKLGKAVVVRTGNEIGKLAKLSKHVAERGVNILAMSAWIEGAEAVIRLVTDDALRTMDVLRDNGYSPHEQNIVLLDAPHKPGILRHLTDTLSRESIDIAHLFASAPINQDQCLVVLNTSDNERATAILNG